MPNQDQNLEVAVARLEERLRNTQSEMERLIAEVARLTKDLEQMTDLVSRWRGGIIVVLAIGSVIGALVSVGKNIWDVFGRH